MAHCQLELEGRGEGRAPGSGLPATEFCFQGVHGCVHVCARVQARRGRGGGLAGLLLVVQRFQAPLKSALGGFQGQGVAGGGDAILNSVSAGEVTGDLSASGPHYPGRGTACPLSTGVAAPFSMDPCQSHLLPLETSLVLHPRLPQPRPGRTAPCLAGRLVPCLRCPISTPPLPDCGHLGGQNTPVSLLPGLGEVVPTGGGRGLRRVSAGRGQAASPSPCPGLGWGCWREFPSSSALRAPGGAGGPWERWSPVWGG